MLGPKGYPRKRTGVISWQQGAAFECGSMWKTLPWVPVCILPLIGGRWVIQMPTRLANRCAEMTGTEHEEWIALIPVSTAREKILKRHGYTIASFSFWVDGL
jgi:hypothetical protein